VRQKIYYPADEEKIPLLLGLLSRSEGARTMVFVNTKAFVERVARSLEKAGYRVGVLSGDVPQKKRESLLQKFQAGPARDPRGDRRRRARPAHRRRLARLQLRPALRCRGLRPPHRPHRALGAEGDAISFACERYAMSLPDIEAYIDRRSRAST
jgi:ATP-dependent RNA helicase RhlB